MEKNHWLSQDSAWQGASPTRKAAIMALLEDENTTGAYHVAGAMVNRAEAEAAAKGKPYDLGGHVSSDAYQPSFDASAKARYDKIRSDPRVDKIQGWIEQRQAGMAPDNVNGATHFLEDPKTMKALQAKDPIYKNWGSGGKNWTAHNPNLPDSAPYGYEVFRPNAEGKGHRFLRPIEYGGSINYDPSQVAIGSVNATPANARPEEVTRGAEAAGAQPTSGLGAGVVRNVNPGIPAFNPNGATIPPTRQFDPSNFAAVPATPVPEEPPALPGAPTPAQGQRPMGHPGSLLNLATGGAPQQGSFFQGLAGLFGGGGQGAAGAANMTGAAGGAETGGMLPSLVALKSAPKPAEIAASPIIQGAPIGGHWNPGAFAQPQQPPQLGWLNVSPFTFGLPRQG
jgi:hypothetical protein